MKVINALSVVVERVKQYVDTALLSKVNSFQGVENKDKLLKVDEQGYVVPVEATEVVHNIIEESYPSDIEGLALVTELGFVEPAVNNGHIFIDKDGSILTI